MSVICMPGIVQLHESGFGYAASEDVVETSMGPIRVSVFRDIRLAEHAWRALQSTNSSAPEQIFEWAKARTDQFSYVHDNDVVIACGRSKTGEVQFVWPFEIVTQNGLRCLQWIGQNYSNHNTGLHALKFSREVTAADIKNLLSRTADITGDVSAAILKSQPEQCNGIRNPLTLLPHRQSAVQGNILLLDRDFETMYRNRFSGRLRNAIARNARNLEKLGVVEFGWATSEAERAELLKVMRQHQVRSYSRHEERNSLFDAEQHAFLHDISCEKNRGDVAVEIAYLKLDGHPVAISSGVFCADTFTLFLTSSDPGPASKNTPDTLLLHYQIEQACRRGVNYFNMGPGDAGYKSVWCDIDAPLFDSVIALDERGYLVTLPFFADAALNRMNKKYTASWTRAKTAMKSLAGRSELPTQLSGFSD